MRKLPFSPPPSAALLAFLLLTGGNPGPLAAADLAPTMTPTVPAAVPPSIPTAENNPLLGASLLPFGYPPFDKIRDEHYAPAFEQGMAEHLREVEGIARNPAPPAFDNTVVALERSGQLIGRVDRIFSNLAGANTNPAIQRVESEMAPKQAAYQDTILLNGPLFARIETLFNQRDALNLDPESRRLLERYHKDFVRAGARLADADKTRLKALNAELASLQTTFTQNVLKEINEGAVLVENKAELAGMTEGELAAAAHDATAAGQDGKFLLRLQNTSGQPPLADLTNRALRERIMAVSLARNSHGGPYDNRGTVTRIARLRAERANLLGYPNHAAYQLEEQTAGDLPTVNRLLADLAAPAVANARKEAAEMQALIDREEQPGHALTAADWSFYSERVRKARFAFDESQLRPYFELDRVLRDGVFYAANRFYGLSFHERYDLPVYHPDVRVFDVTDADGKPLALFIADFYARPSKRGGAWMNEYVNQSGLLGERAVVANHLNIPKPAAGEPTLLTLDEARTMFHEFGHALHGMFSNVKYPRFAGTNVPRDFVEFPSQVNEMWRDWPEVLQHYARHYQTGEPLPKELLDKVLAADRFNQGFKTTEYLAASLLDQAYHQLKPEEVPTDPVAFEAAALKKVGLDFAPVPPRYRSTYFSHSFSGGYSAGYYSYIWSEVLDADSVEWIKQHGGLTRENGDRFRRTLLSRGGSDEALTLFKNFTGGPPDVAPLLQRRGLATGAPAAAAAGPAVNEIAPPSNGAK